MRLDGSDYTTIKSALNDLNFKFEIRQLRLITVTQLLHQIQIQTHKCSNKIHSASLRGISVKLTREIDHQRDHDLDEL